MPQSVSWAESQQGISRTIHNHHILITKDQKTGLLLDRFFQQVEESIFQVQKYKKNVHLPRKTCSTLNTTTDEKNGCPPLPDYDMPPLHGRLGRLEPECPAQKPHQRSGRCHSLQDHPSSGIQPKHRQVSNGHFDARDLCQQGYQSHTGLGKSPGQSGDSLHPFRL
jgi:hypothetical protein